jgi:hypothetical protein
MRCSCLLCEGVPRGTSCLHGWMTIPWTRFKNPSHEVSNPQQCEALWSSDPLVTSVTQITFEILIVYVSKPKFSFPAMYDGVERPVLELSAPPSKGLILIERQFTWEGCICLLYNILAPKMWTGSLVFNSLRRVVNHRYHLLQHSVTLHVSKIVYLWVSSGSQNK